MRTRTKWFIRGVAVLAVAGVNVVGAVLWAHSIFLWDGYGHRGFYRCDAAEVRPGHWRTCWRDVDETLLQETMSIDGTIVRSWFVGGATEYAREIIRPGQPAKVLRHRVMTEWMGGDGRDPPHDYDGPDDRSLQWR